MEFLKPKRNVHTTFIHCSASDLPAHDSVEIIREWHLKRGFDDVGYHWLITKDGFPHPGRSLETIPAAQKGNNTNSLAICVSGLKNFKIEQMETLQALCRRIDEEYGYMMRFQGHREVANKSCPVFDYKSVLCLDDDGRMRRYKRKFGHVTFTG